MDSEAAAHADFQSILRYAQCWEDADILLDALEIAPGDTCLAVASAGDNALSMLSRGPARVIAIDLNPAQLAAVRLRVAAYRELSHVELLELMGSRDSGRRAALYQRCRSQLDAEAKAFWDARSSEVEQGIGAAGKFERYFRLFRTWILPLVHRRSTVDALIVPRDRAGRLAFYERSWDTRPWRLLFRAFFSEWSLGRLGRDPSFFKYAEGDVASHLLGRVRHALVELEPARNPYLQWILTGSHPGALPHALRPENFEAIRANLDRLELRCAPMESLDRASIGAPVDCHNLSDIFEYMSSTNAAALFTHIADLSKPGSRLAYWNMIVPREGALLLPDRLRPNPGASKKLFERDKAFFYRAFIVENVIC